MTLEGRLLKKLLRWDKAEPQGQIEVFLSMGCDQPNCPCKGRAAVRLTAGDVTVDIYHRESVASLVYRLEKASAMAWGGTRK